MIDNISCLMWKEADGSYSVEIRREGRREHRAGLTIREALDMIETAIYMRFDAGVEQ